MKIGGGINPTGGVEIMGVEFFNSIKNSVSTGQYLFSVIPLSRWGILMIFI